MCAAASDMPFGDILQNIENGSLDKEQRMIIAKGFLPLEPELLAAALLLLSRDSDEAIADAAQDTITEMPVNIVQNLGRNKQISPELLHMLAELRIADEDVLETIVLNPIMSNKTFEYIAKYGPAKIVEILAGNQERLLQNMEFVNAILGNSHASQFVKNRLETFKREMKEQREAKEATQRAAFEQVIAEPIVRERPPSKPEPEPVSEKVIVEEKPVVQKTAPKKAPVPDDDIEVIDEDIEFMEDEPVVSDDRHLTFAQRILTMSVADKVKLATLGSREERLYLITEKIRLITNAVIKSPKTTEDDIEAISKMKNVIDDVLRDIGNKREYTKNPTIRRNLLENPRTPIGVSLNLIKYVTDKELNELAKNKNIPDALRKTAKRVIQQKEMRKKAKTGGKH